MSDDYKDLAGWLERVSQSSPPPEDIVAYNFGIFESEGGYTLHLIGSREYDPDNDDWACREDYVPVEKYFELPKSFGNGGDWRGVQHKVVGLIKRFIGSSEPTGSPFTRASAITVGFDDGDLERVA